MKAQHVKRLVVLVTVAGALAAGAATAQDGHLWPRFSVAAGGYLISSTDKIGIDGEIGVAGRDVSFSQDLGLPKDKTLLGLGLEWTPWARHSFDFEYYSFDRSGSRSSSRQIQVGDRVFPVGAEVSASLKTTSIEAGYTYWFMHRERFGFGATAGLVYLELDADASATAFAGNGSATFSDSASASTDLPVPMIGVNVKGQPWDRVVLFVRARFLPSVTVDKYDGESASYSVGADVYVWQGLALGVSYDGHYYRAEVDDSSWKGSLDADSSGWLFYLRYSF